MSKITINTGVAQLDLKISDGRKHFWQWDSGCQLNVIGCPDVSELHYFRQGLNEPMTLKVYKSGNKILCDVPDELLQESIEFVVYAYQIDADGNSTQFSKRFAVKERPKPTDYVYTPTEQYTINAKINNALEEAKASGEFDGEKGDPGYTPQKGTDYWTEAEKEEIIQDVLHSLPVYDGEVVQ